MSTAPHIPVMRDEAIDALGLGDQISGGTFIDGTFGAGGYTRAMLSHGDARVIGIDRDPNVASTARAFKSEFGVRFDHYRGAFSDMGEAANQLTKDGLVEGVVLDIGVSSMQLDRAERGFSFMRAGPLDMRMAASGPSAADAVNHMSAAQLTRIFQVYGEERRARRCADFIIRAREEGYIGTTDNLAEIISKALGRSGKTHPATRVFQALRIFINDELGELCRALSAAEQILRPGGKLVIVTFHSLEDKIVKAFFRARAGETQGRSRHLPPEEVTGPAPTFSLAYRSAIKPSKAELEVNVRARSAKLRAGARTTAPAWEESTQGLMPQRVPNLVDLERVMG